MAVPTSISIPRFAGGGEIRGHYFFVPEPSSLALVLMGLVGCVARRPKR
jgi:hypothetical protein